MKKNYGRKLLAVVLAFALVFSVVALNGFRPRLQRVTILTTSDLQSQIVPFNTKVYIDGVKTKVKAGGAARIAGLVKELKWRNGNASTLFLTSGDDFHGPVFRAFGGIPTTYLWDQIADV